MSKLQGSVGLGAQNLPVDVHAVQALLVQIGLQPGPADGVCREPTVDAIKQFQSGFMGVPDGVVNVGGITWTRLTGEAAPADVTAVAPQWSGDSSQWTHEKKLLSLEPAFRAKIEQVIAALKNQAFQPKIVFGWRSVAVQKQLFDEKKTKVLFSFHNAQLKDGTPNALAVDIIDTRWAWSDAAQANGFWNALGTAGKGLGLVWGGDWNDFPDVAHLQGRQNSELAQVKKDSGLSGA